MTKDETNGDRKISDEEFRCLQMLYAHDLQAEPPPVKLGVREDVLRRLEARGLIERASGPILPLEMKRVNYRLTAAGVAAYLVNSRK